MTKGKKLIDQWFTNRKWKAFDYQKDVWKNVLDGKNGLLNAPTGNGKTFALHHGSLDTKIREWAASRYACPALLFLSKGYYFRHLEPSQGFTLSNRRNQKW